VISVMDAIQTPAFRHCVSRYDRMGAVKVFLVARYPGHELRLDYTKESIAEANMYADIAFDKQVSDALSMMEEMR